MLEIQSNNSGNEQQESNNAGNVTSTGSPANATSTGAAISLSSSDRFLLQQAYKAGYDAGSGGYIDSCDNWYGEMVKTKYQCGFGAQMCAFPKDTILYCHQGFVAGQHDKETGKIH